VLRGAIMRSMRRVEEYCGTDGLPRALAGIADCPKRPNGRRGGGMRRANVAGCGENGGECRCWAHGGRLC
jgi:hypothetical protein